MLEYNGKWYARVSDVLAPLKDFGHINPDVLKNKQEIGTMVHQAISDDVAGDFPILTLSSHGYYRSYLLWKETVNPAFLLSEKRFFHHELRLTGCIDALVRLPHSSLPTLVDFKTSAMEDPQTWPLQAHLYAHLMEMPQQLASHFLFIKLDKGGKAPKVFSYLYDTNTMNRCLDLVGQFWSSQEGLHVK